MLRRLVLSVCGLLLATAANAASAPPRIPAETFGKFGNFSSLELSPLGTKSLAQVTLFGKTHLAIINFAEKDPQKNLQLIPVGKSQELLWFRWASDTVALVGISQINNSFGYPIPVSRVLSFDVSTKAFSLLGPQKLGIAGDEVIHVAPDGSHILLAAARSVYETPSVFRVDLATKASTLVVRPKSHIWAWFADDKGVVRGGVGISGRKFWLIYRDTDGSDFETIYRDKWEDSEGEVETVQLVSGRDKGFAISNTRTGRFGLYEFNLSTKEIGTPLFEHPAVDIDDVLWSSDMSRVDGVTYIDDRFRVQWFDPEMKKLQAALDKALPGNMNWVTSRNRDNTRAIVWSGSASDPGKYYLLDRKTRRMDPIGASMQWIDAASMAEVKSVKYTARDGLEIPAYLTLPSGRDPRKLPLIVMPHGGPFARDTWGYDAEVQLLANRGYAVLQPNYRGSTGFGRAYVEKGQGQFGRGMQDDLDDGVAWLVKEGIVDAGRVCIMGASYGGYAALIGATRQPQIWRCAVSFAGISDMKKMMSYDRRQLAPKRYRKWREDVQGDKAFDLDSISPLKAIDHVRIPVLLFHGEEDGNVPPYQSKMFADAMKKAGKPVEHITYKEEGHGFNDEDNFIDYLKRIDAFLAKHNPAN